MLIHFPSAESLLRAALGGAIPDRMLAAPVELCRLESGTLLVRCAGRVTVSCRRALENFGATAGAELEWPDAPSIRARCWIELLPLKRHEPTPSELSNRTVLFEIAPAREADELSAELLRLGNDRLAVARADIDGAERTLIRVAGPPYFTVLRTTERIVRADATNAAGGDEGRVIRAYVERQPGLWIEVGWSLPVSRPVVVPAREWRLVRSPNVWIALTIPAFTEVDDAVEFVLPETAAPRPLPARPIERLRVPLRLEPGESNASPSLWILRGGEIERFEDFVATTRDEVLERLLFAVVGNEERCVLVRARPGMPPVVAFEGTAYRSHADLENLFVPCGRRLVPPVRRSLFQRLLADDPDRITWLEPTIDGGFRTLSVDEAAFRPLLDWVDYVLDRDRERLDAWSESFACDFDESMLADDTPPLDDQPTTRLSERRPQTTSDRANDVEDSGPSSSGSADSDAPSVPDGETQPGAAPEHAAETRSRAAESRTDGASTSHDPEASSASDPRMPDATAAIVADVEAANARLAELIEAFRKDDGTFDSPLRRSLWRELASTYERLGRHREAASCCEHALWDAASDTSLADHWRRAALRAAGLDDGATTESATRRVVADVLARPAPSAAEALVVASSLVADADGSSALSLTEASRFLERHESLLPVRAAWLSWGAVARLSGGDALALARARERLLGRLHLQGIVPALDGPPFLDVLPNVVAARNENRVDLLHALDEDASAWIARERRAAHSGPAPLETTDRTGALARMTFAFGLALAGDSAASEAQERRAAATFDTGDPIHGWLLDAWRFRLNEARSGRPGAPLPVALVDRLNRGPLDQITVGPHRLRAPLLLDELRRKSLVLDPTSTRAAAWRRTESIDPLVAAARRVFEIEDPEARRAAARDLRSQLLRTGEPTATRAAALEILLSSAPSLGADGTAELLADVVPLADASLEPLVETALWDRALNAAAATDLRRILADLIEALSTRFGKLLSARSNPQDLEPLASLLGRSARSLRRLGLTTVLSDLMERTTTAIAALSSEPSAAPPSDAARSGAVPPSRAARETDRPSTPLERRIASLALVLRLTPAALQFGDEVGVARRLDEAESILFSEASTVPASARSVWRLWLARAWCDAVGSLDLERAAARWRGFFPRLQGIRRPTTADALFSLPLLSIVEQVVLATRPADRTLDPATQRLLDDGEHTVRRRIEDDLRRLV